MNKPKLRLILPAAPYANGPLHAGRIGGSLLPADIFNRYCKIRGIPTYFGVVSDCHGTPIMISAEKEKVDYDIFAKSWHNRMIKTIQKWNIEVDYFHSTQDELHKNYVTVHIKDLLKKNALKYSSTKEFYCETCKKMPVDRYIEGTCLCGFKVQGYECENCSTILDNELIKTPYCRNCKKELKLIDSENYLLNLSEFKDDLLKKYVSSHFYEDIVKYYNEKGNKERPILRNISWGIKNPLERGEGVVYVWIEALYSYLSFTEQKRKNPYLTYHFIGKDNLHFHTVIYNHLLKYHEYPFIDKISVRNWFLFKGLKQSSSRKNYIDLFEIIEENEDIKSDFFRGYVSYNDTLNKDSNLSIEEYNKFCNYFTALFHNLFYRTYSYYKKNRFEFELDLEGVELCEEYIDLQESFKLIQIWQHMVTHANSYNEYFQTKRDLISYEEHKTLFLNLYILLLELTPFMPYYTEKWLNLIKNKTKNIKFEDKPFHISVDKLKI
jgi:methionyl-tRNA synthetase